MLSLLGLLAYALVLFSVALGHPVPKRSSLFPPPHDDPFYNAPDNLESLAPGAVYTTRDVEPVAIYLFAKSISQIAYRTTDTSGNASHTVATVFTPDNPDKDTKLFSYQFWEDSDNIDCSPSYSLYGGLLTPDGITSSIDTPIYVDWALSKGYYVVVPDHEGPLSTFFAGFTEGYGGLDGIRAAISHLSLSESTAVALYGYSGGAHASVWMSELAGSYAPEINIVGAAHGGTPLDPTTIVNFIDGTSWSGFVLGALAGYIKAYPTQGEQIWSVLDANLQAQMNTIWSDNTCILNEVLGFGMETVHKMTSLQDLFTYAPMEYILQNESLLNNVSSRAVATPKFPRYLFHARNDEVIPYSNVQQYVSQQCGNGANIQLVTWPGGEHASTEILGIPNALQFLQQAFEGKTPGVACGTAAQDILTVTTKGVGSVIGDFIVDAIKALDGVLTPFGVINLNL